MKFFSFAPVAARTPLAGAVVWALAMAAPAADPSARFVEALRNEGHVDLALEFLERADDDPLVSDAFRERVPYERLATLYSQALSIRDAAARRSALETLVPDLRRLAASSESARALLTDATDRLATAAADEARRLALVARRLPEGSDREQRLREARSALETARERLAEAEQALVEEREPLKGVQPDSEAGRRRADLGARLGLVRLLRARLLHEVAQTYPEGSGDWRRLNKDAADQLGSLYEKYSKWGIGLYAHLYEGRCYRLLGEAQLAAAALEDLTAQPAPTPELRRIVTLAHAELAALRLGQGDAEDALDEPAEWLDELSPAEASGPEGAELRYRLGLAAAERADELSGAAGERMKRQAREWLEDSARTPSEVQADARSRWAELAASAGVGAATPETFDEAFQAGAEAIQAMLALDVQIDAASGAERDRLREQREASRSAAYSALTTAARLADEDTDPERAAKARYQVAWLDWEAGDAAEAAVRAEYVARRDAETETAEDAARLALAALERLEREGGADAAERLGDFVDFVTSRWPDSDVAASAAAVRIASALREGDLEAARGVLETVSDEQRPELALRLAVAEWEKTKSSAARESLREALDAATGDGEASSLAVTAALYLAEAALDAGEADRARSLLNHPDYGPATRLAGAKPPTNTPAVALATLKSMVRADALVGRPVDAAIERLATLLEETPAEQTGGERAWLAIAASLYGDLDRAPGDQRVQVAAALAAVLDRLGPVEEAGDWNTRLWIAQARLRVGELLADEAAARENLAAGAAAFERLIERAETSSAFAPSDNAVLAARLRLAQCQRELGDYAAAVESLTTMLRGGAVLLEVQREAAETLQAWGAATKSVERLEQAIAGAEPGDDGKNLIWGWSKLASIAGRYAAGDPKRRELFFDAWRNVAASRYEAAQLASGAERAEQLRKAASTILALQRQNPGLGGNASRQAFDRLLREIQTAAGDQPTGLANLDG